MATACDGHAAPGETTAPDDAAADKPQAADPAAVASVSLVRRFVDANPEAAHAARREGSVCVVEVTAPSWVAPLAEAWRSLAMGHVAPAVAGGTDQPDGQAGGAWPVRAAHRDDEEPDDAPLIQFLRDGGDYVHRSGLARDRE